MSELKAKHVVDVYVEYSANPYKEDQVYIKSEADKVIAELQKQVHDYAQGLYVIQARAEKEARHHKYKRCLAMADYCYTNVHCIMGHRLCAFSDRKKEWFERWHNRWLDIAPSHTRRIDGKSKANLLRVLWRKEAVEYDLSRLAIQRYVDGCMSGVQKIS